MSEWQVRAVTIGEIQPHPNADTLGITYVDQYPVVVKLGAFEPGETALYIPVDSVLPQTPAFDGVYQYTRKGRVQAARLRGQFSMGLLHKVDGVDDYNANGDWEGYFGITKYERPGDLDMSGDGESVDDPGWIPKYDLDGYRRYPEFFTIGEPVILTEKLHGANIRVGYRDGEFFVGSKNRFVNPEGNTIWARVAREQGLKESLANDLDTQFLRGVALYGEVLGVQSLMYGLTKGALDVRWFDVYDPYSAAFLSYPLAESLLTNAGLSPVPCLAVAAWHPLLLAYAEQDSGLAGHMREGIVIRTLHEDEAVFPDGQIGRAVLKYPGERYLLSGK